MKALGVAVIYFGSFLALGVIARAIIRRWTSDMDLPGHRKPDERQGQRNRRFLLGSWRNDD
jgi:hypothetical protein